MFIPIFFYNFALVNNNVMTTEDFILKARAIHGDKYDYSKVEYINKGSEICIICPEHGEFWQKPGVHLKGCGCPICGRKLRKKMTTPEFIEKSKAIHGDKYDYSKVEYVRRHDDVCIICPEHGEFWQLPHIHLKGSGCPICGRNKGKKRVTTEDFICKAREVHGDKYDYSKVEYVNAITPVCIVCPEHGEFWQTPSSHLKGYGCKECTGKIATTEDFIKKAQEVHGDKYNYSKVEYVNANTKVCIICPEHGEFWQLPNTHLKSGCPKCAGKNKTTEDFIKEARKVHGDKYDYSKVDYVDCYTKVCIICPIHGEFWQTPGSHLNGSGCRECGLEIARNAKRVSTQDFIKEARKVHCDKYDYSKVEYVNTKTPVCIICPIHGEVWQLPKVHLNGVGCPKCFGRHKTTEEFIKEAKAVHGDKYDYSKVKYVNSKEKICVICPDHGEFWITPNNHLRGGGCRKCAIEKQRETFRLSTEEFIRRARAVHGDKYDYSKVEYIDSQTNVCIICPEHGEFWQNPSNHCNGYGCPKCAGKGIKLTNEEFIAKAREVHGDKYDYSKVEYVNTKTPITIICPIHGEFKQTPRDHLKDHGCPRCGWNNKRQRKFNLLEEFENEYAFRAFLENSDTNILMIILRNLEPKFDPIKRDLEKALASASDENPIESLKKKYSDCDDVSWAEQPTDSINDVDLDDDEAVSTVIRKNTGSNGVSHNVEVMMHNFEEEVNVINRIEHMLTPEDRKYIMEKFLNDKRRAWMLEREESVK